MISILLWPFTALWNCLAFLVKLAGRLIGGAIGLLVLALGILCLLNVSLALGAPVALLGALLMVRSVF